MPKNTTNLPYFKITSTVSEIKTTKFLRRKFFPRIREKIPNHYLIQSVPFKNLQTIKKLSKRYPYFLRLDISLYYPSINHEILLKKLSEIYESISQKILSRHLKQCIKNDIPAFLQKSPYKKGLPIGSSLSYVLAGIFLLDLDFKIKNPFLRYNDDYLIFCKSKRESELILKNIVIPTLNGLNLEINYKKLKSGKFYNDKVDFIGFEFFAGYFRIKQEKIEEFKKEIVKITRLNRKKSKEAIIRLLNNKILGFGHYYKFASCKTDFKDLDSSIRMRLRRYLLTQKALSAQEDNLVLTNEALQSLGLKSLMNIKLKFDGKGTIKTKKPIEIGLKKSRTDWHKVEDLSDKYYKIQILKQLNKLTTLTTLQNKRLLNIGKKLEKLI